MLIYPADTVNTLQTGVYCCYLKIKRVRRKPRQDTFHFIIQMLLSKKALTGLQTDYNIETSN